MNDVPPSASNAVTVVVATHNELSWGSLDAALASLYTQSTPPARIVVAVDHNPELETRLRAARPDVLVVANDSPHRGASATRNAGASRAETQLIAFLDDDEVAESDWLATLIAPFDDDRVVGTGGRYVADWQAGKPGWFPDELAWVVGAHHTGMPSQTARVRNVWSGNMAVRKSIFDSVDGFRAGFGKVGSRSRPEDTDLCIRMAAATPSGHWLYLPDARIHHAVPRDRSTFAFFVRRCYAEGRGKIDLLYEHTGTDALATERDYLRHTIPTGLRLHVRHGSAGLSRALAILAGVAAAAVGAVVSKTAPRRGGSSGATT